MVYTRGVMAELGCEMFVSYKAYPLVKDKIEQRLYQELRAAGCVDIVIEEPRHEYVESFVDEESGETLGGYWGWGIYAEGVKP